MLPKPDADERRHSARLCELIRARVGDGWVGFDAFMEAALYAPGLGYYARGANFGGDFVTAPMLGGVFGGVSGVFAKCIAAQVAEVLTETGGGVLEFGAGDGRLALDTLINLHALGAPPSRYLILETSAALQHRQRETVAAAGALAECVRWVTTPPAKFTGVVVANEVLDAMPAMRFVVDGGEAFHLGVGVGDDGKKFCWTKTNQPLSESLQKRLTEHQLADGYRSEICTHAEAWVRSLGATLDAGAMLLIDYGFPRREFYHADRNDGAVMCHYRHRAHADPFFYPGLQDISAHLDFTALADAAHDAGMSTAGFASQGAFVLSLGALDFLPDAPPSPSASREIQTLTMPHEMGELFKVIAFTKNCDRALTGFAMQDRSGRL